MHLGSRHPRPVPRRRRAARPNLEPLESRLALTTLIGGVSTSNYDNLTFSEKFETTAVAGQSRRFDALANFQHVTDPTGFTANIHWGDGLPDSPADGNPVTIAPDPRIPQFLFDINGTHTYPAGISTTYHAYVQLTSPDGNQTWGGPAGPLTYVVVNAPPQPQPEPPQPEPPQPEPPQPEPIPQPPPQPSDPTPKVEIDINDTPIKTDDITLLNPSPLPQIFRQDIPARVTNQGPAGTFRLVVEPAGAAELSETVVSLPTGASAEVMITPLRVSSAPNDVRIEAVRMEDGAVAGSGALTIVSVTTPQHIRNADTPDAMVQDRIPPRMPSTFPITVTPDLGDSKQFITLAVAGQSDTNGTVALNDGATANLTAPGSVKLKGGKQTAPSTSRDLSGLSAVELLSPAFASDRGGGNAGNLRLVVQVRGQDTVQSDGFSVAAIPRNWQFTLNKDLTAKLNRGLNKKFPRDRGMVVNDFVESDSGNPADLSSVYTSEQVNAVISTGVFLRARYQNSDYLRDFGLFRNGYSIRDIDNHVFPYRSIRAPGGRSVVAQVSIFVDQRTGAVNIPVTNSGYFITRQVSRGSAKRPWGLLTGKSGGKTSANGYASDAGGGSDRQLF
jgi:hypothetical protein